MIRPGRHHPGVSARRSGLWLLLVALLVPWPALAISEVLVVVAERSAPHEEVLAAMRASLADALDRKIVLRVTAPADFGRSPANAGDRRRPDLVVTIGTEAASAVLAGRQPVPVLCAFLPESSYDALLQARGPDAQPELALHSAIFLDQPLHRQMQLLRLALPRHTRIGVVLGPESRRSEATLQRAAIAAGRTLRVERIADEKQLIQALYRVMDEADVLLAVPDPLVFNRHTAQSVLLTTYRLGKPVAGYSRAYAGAGALLAVYSTPAQIGRQIGETLRALAEAPGRALPPPRHPRYFSVEVNERVAHSLGLDPGPEVELARRLVEGEAEEVR